MTSRSSASCTASLWIERHALGALPIVAQASSAAVSCAISSSGGRALRAARPAAAIRRMRTCLDYAASRAAASHSAVRTTPQLVLLADAGLPRTGEAALTPSDDRRLGYLPDCERPLAGAHSAGHVHARSHAVTTLRLALVLAARDRGSLALAACTRVETAAAPPPLPQVTAAAAVARDVTEWDEFTGRLEPVQSVGVRPRVSGLISTRVVRGRQPRPAGAGALPARRPPVPGAGRSAARRAGAGRRRRATAPPPSMRRADRLSTENAMSLEERERRAGAAAEATAHVDAVAAALRAAELDLEFTRVVSPIDGRVSRALVTRGNLVSGGQGEATLLTTVVSVDPIYASFDADEQTFLRYGERVAPAGPGRARGGLPIQMALADEADVPARRARCSSSTTSSIRRPARSTAARSSAIADRRLTPGLFVRLRLPGTVVLPRRARRGSRRRHRSRSPLRAGRRRRQERSQSRPVDARADRRRPARRAQRPDRRRAGRGQRPAARAARRAGRRRRSSTMGGAQ